MSDMALPGSIEPARHGPKLDHQTNPLAAILLMGVVAAGILFVAYSIYSDIDAAGVKITAYMPFLLLFVAFLIALGFEFVNGFHDTANAVATVIYTRSLPANFAVVWSGMSTCSACSVVEGGGFRHHFAVPGGVDPPGRIERRLCHGLRAPDRGDHLDLGTWWFGFPASSSHTLIGSVIGVGMTNGRLNGRSGTSVDWARRPRSAKRCCFRRSSALSSRPSCCWS